MNPQPDHRQIAADISLIENKRDGYEALLISGPGQHAKVIGITGAPGSGKSTLADGLIGEMVADKRKVAVLSVDPSSPFHRGALLGDRIRMSEWYSHPDVYIRSLASRGSLGGLHPMIIGISEYIKRAGFDFVIIETIGVGQSEVDIAALADVTIVVLVPEGGDSIQSMKSGLMEVGDLFVVNKSDRPGAEQFARTIKRMTGRAFRQYERDRPVFTSAAHQREGIHEIYNFLKTAPETEPSVAASGLLAKQAYALIRSLMMENVNEKELRRELEKEIGQKDFNLYAFAKKMKERYLGE